MRVTRNTPSSTAPVPAGLPTSTAIARVSTHQPQRLRIAYRTARRVVRMRAAAPVHTYIGSTAQLTAMVASE